MPSNAVQHARTHGYRYKIRATHAPAIQLTERDTEILAAVHKYRVLHRGHICELFFQGNDDEGGSARRRLGLLYQHGYLERIPRFINPPINNPGPAYRLAARGAILLAQMTTISVDKFNYWGKAEDKEGRATKLGHSYLEHNLLLADIRMAFERKVTEAGMVIPTWLDYHDLRPSWKTERALIRLTPAAPEENVAIAPDGYFVLQTQQGRGHFFLEADRGTETVDKQWRRKILAYKAYLLSGQFHKRYGVPRNIGFRVLTLVPSVNRAKNLQRAVERNGSPEGTSAFLFAPTPAFLISGLSDPIWLRAGLTVAQGVL